MGGCHEIGSSWMPCSARNPRATSLSSVASSGVCRSGKLPISTGKCVSGRDGSVGFHGHAADPLEEDTACDAPLPSAACGDLQALTDVQPLLARQRTFR